MKKLLLLVLAVICFAPCTQIAAMEHSTTQNIPNNQIWYTSSDGNVVTPNETYVFGATIKSNTYSNGKGVITFDGNVTMIGEEAFYNRRSLTSVTIPDSVTTIGLAAFGRCNSLVQFNGKFVEDNGRILVVDGTLVAFAPAGLTRYIVPNSVTSIGERAFQNCSSLTSVNIPDSVTTIGDAAFTGCDSLKEFKGKYATEDGRSLIVDNTIIAYANVSGNTYTIPDSVTEIGDAAFAGCSSLTSVNIPDSVTEIEYYAFRHCDSLTSVNIPDSVTTIEEAAFADCSSLTSVTIGDSVTTIGRDAFEDCTSLTSVNIPDSVTEIGEGAFWGCDSLTSVTIGDSVTTIGEWAFYSCTSLKSINIPDSVTEIGEYAFLYCTSLTSVNIPDSVTEIGESAFYYCKSLTSVNIHDSVTKIGSSAFSDCTNLKEFKGKYATEDGRSLIVDNTIIAYANVSGNTYTIPDSVTEIGYNAFRSCYSLTRVNIPDSVTTIGESAFLYCRSLTSVYCKATTPPALGSYVFLSNGSGRKIYVPAGSVNAYKSATNWTEYASAIVGYDFENDVVVE